MASDRGHKRRVSVAWEWLPFRPSWTRSWGTSSSCRLFRAGVFVSAVGGEPGRRVAVISCCKRKEILAPGRRYDDGRLGTGVVCGGMYCRCFPGVVRFIMNRVSGCCTLYYEYGDTFIFLPFPLFFAHSKMFSLVQGPYSWGKSALIRALLRHDTTRSEDNTVGHKPQNKRRPLAGLPFRARAETPAIHFNSTKICSKLEPMNKSMPGSARARASAELVLATTAKPSQAKATKLSQAGTRAREINQTEP